MLPDPSAVASACMSKDICLSPCNCCTFFLQATVSPGESALVAIVGTGVLKMFKIADQTLKPLPLNANRRDTLSFTCQTWVPLTDKGGDGSGAAAAAGDAAKGGSAASGAAAAGADRERQLMGTVDGEILLFEVSCCSKTNHNLPACALSWTRGMI